MLVIVTKITTEDKKNCLPFEWKKAKMRVQLVQWLASRNKKLVSRFRITMIIFTYFRTNNFEKFRSLFLLPSWVEIAGKTGQYPLKLLFK